MFMSLFSAFDALSAESFGIKLPAIPPSPFPDNNNKQDSAAVKVDGDVKNKGRDVDSSSKKKKPVDRGRRMIAPRFAPELDGVHCFENILPY